MHDYRSEAARSVRLWRLALPSALLVMLGIGIGIGVARPEPRAVASNEQPSSEHAEVEAIKRELLHLHRESARLRRLVEDAKRDESAERAPAEETAEPPPPALRAPMPAEQYFASVEQVFEHERSDPHWDPAPALTNTLAKVIPEDASLEAVTCRKTLCRVQTSHATVDSYRAFTRAFILPRREPIWTGPAVFADVDNQAGGASVTGIIYLGKESLPDLPEE